MNWYILVSTIAGEFRALADLQSRKFDAYLPLQTRIRTIRGQKRPYDSPLLPRYLFVCVDDADSLGEVRSLATVQEVLPHEHAPIPIPAHEIDSWKRRQEAGEFRFRETVTGRKKHRKILRAFQELVVLREKVYVDAS